MKKPHQINLIDKIVFELICLIAAYGFIVGVVFLVGWAVSRIIQHF